MFSLGIHRDKMFSTKIHYLFIHFKMFLISRFKLGCLNITGWCAENPGFKLSSCPQMYFCSLEQRSPTDSSGSWKYLPLTLSNLNQKMIKFAHSHNHKNKNISVLWNIDFTHFLILYLFVLLSRKLCLLFPNLLWYPITCEKLNLCSKIYFHPLGHCDSHTDHLCLKGWKGRRFMSAQLSASYTIFV